MKLLDNTIINFPDGHKHLKAISGHHKFVQVAIKSFDDLFLLAQFKEVHPECETLDIKYLLGARCDRRFSEYEALDLKIVGTFINDLNFELVTILQPHSKVALDLIDRSQAADVNYGLIESCLRQNEITRCSLVAPDSGASKWVHRYTVDPNWCHMELVQGHKARDEQGYIIDTYVKGKVEETCIILDDLCDGGATFIHLAKALRSRGAKKVYLCVTHGIFSKGFEVFRGLIDGIYTTNSFQDWYVRDTSRINADVIKKVINVWN